MVRCLFHSKFVCSNHISAYCYVFSYNNSLVAFTNISDENKLTVPDNFYNKAIEAYKTVIDIKNKLNDTDTEYNKLIYKIADR